MKHSFTLCLTCVESNVTSGRVHMINNDVSIFQGLYKATTIFYFINNIRKLEVSVAFEQ